MFPGTVHLGGTPRPVLGVKVAGAGGEHLVPELEGELALLAVAGDTLDALAAEHGAGEGGSAVPPADLILDPVHVLQHVGVHACKRKVCTSCSMTVGHTLF